MSEPASQAEQGPGALPTGEPIPTAPEAPATSTSNPPSSTPDSDSCSPSSSRTPAALLRALPTKADAFLTHLQRCLYTPAGADTVLLFLSYHARLAGVLATTLSHALLRQHLAALTLLLPRAHHPAASSAAAVIITAATARRRRAAHLAAALAARLKALGGLAAEARTIARLWALLSMYSWAKRLLRASPPLCSAAAAAPSTTTAAAQLLVDGAQLLACTAFQALENGAYLSARGVLGWPPARQARALVLASRWLALHTGLEVGKLAAGMLAAAAARQRRGGGGGGCSGGEAEEEEEEEKEEDRAARAAVRRSMAINLAWTPLTLHWAAENGFLSELAVALGGCVPGMLQMRKLWRDTAQ